MKIIKIIIIVLTVTLLLTGCKKGYDFNNEEDVKKYLNAWYPNEEFKIEVLQKSNHIEKDEVGEPISDNCIKAGNRYRVTSKETNITFIVEDGCHYNGFYDQYDIKNNYSDVALEKIISDNTETKMEIFRSCDACIKSLASHRNNYNTDEEMINDIWNIVTQLNDTYPFKHRSIQKRLEIYISTGDEYSSYYLADITSKEKLTAIVKDS